MRSEHKHEHMKSLENYLTRLEKNATNLISVSFNTFAFNNHDVLRLCHALKKNTHLSSLDLVDCNIKAEHIPLIADAIKHNSSITSIQIEEFHDDVTKTKKYIKQIRDHVIKNQENNKKSKSLGPR